MPKIESNVSTFIIAATIAAGLLFSSLEAPRPPAGADYALYVGTAAEAQGSAKPRPPSSPPTAPTSPSAVAPSRSSSTPPNVSGASPHRV